MCGTVLSSWQAHKARQRQEKERGTFVDLMYQHEMT